jgi:hypothetical protein
VNINNYYTSTIKAPNGELVIFEFQQRYDSGVAEDDPIYELWKPISSAKLFTEHFNANATRTLQSTDVAVQGIVMPHKNDYAMAELPRFIPFTEGFLKLDADENGALVSTFTSYQSIPDSVRLNDPVGLNNALFTTDAWIAGGFYYWKAKNKIYRIKFEAAAQVEEVIDDGGVSAWMPLSNAIIATINSQTVVIDYTGDIQVVADEDLNAENAIDLEPEGDTEVVE